MDGSGGTTGSRSNRPQTADRPAAVAYLCFKCVESAVVAWGRWSGLVARVEQIVVVRADVEGFVRRCVEGRKVVSLPVRAVGGLPGGRSLAWIVHQSGSGLICILAFAQ